MAACEERITRDPRLLSIGYEGQKLDPFIYILRAAQVQVLVDVRLNAIGRRPGFSKTALRSRLATEGIECVHLRALGNPRDNRQAFGATTSPARARFAALLDSTEARDALEKLCRLTQDALVAVLCFEQNESECHRMLIIDAVQQMLRQTQLAV